MESHTSDKRSNTRQTRPNLGSYHLEDSKGKRLPRPWNVEHLKGITKRSHSLIVKPNLILCFSSYVSDYSEFTKLLFNISQVLFSISQVLPSNSCAIISSSKDQNGRPE